MEKQELIDKQALIDKLMKIPGVGSNGDALKTIKRFPSYEPQKVKVPKFVADWIEEVKQRGCGLADALNCFDSPIMPEDVKEWVEFNSSAIGCHHDHQELLARAWLDGYEVKEEPKYRVKVGNGYFISYQGRGCLISPHEKDGIMNFDSMKEANRTADIVGGTVEKV